MTTSFILVWVALAILYTLWRYLVKPETTISFTMSQWACRYPFLPWALAFIAGVLCGHFFWPIDAVVPSSP